VNGNASAVTVTTDSSDPDERALLWANQGGGGGNFGIITRYWFRELPPAPSEAFIANLAWEWCDLTKDAFTALVLRYGDFLMANSDPGSPYEGLFTLLHLTQQAAEQVTLTAQYVGDTPSLLDDFIAFITQSHVQLANVVRQRVPVGRNFMPLQHATPQMLPWLYATQTFDGSGPNQRGKYKSAYMTQGFPLSQIDTMYDCLTATSYSNKQALLQVDSYGCTINRVPSDATAVPQRSSIMKLQYQTYWTDPADDATNLDWIREFYVAMYGPKGPLPDGTMDGCYVNYPDSDLVNWETLYYLDAYPRLQQVKQRWDPNNVFNHAQSIRLPGS